MKVRDGRSGFTLLEILLALAIVGIALTAILQLFSANLRAISASEEQVRASLRAEAIMREITDSEKLEEKNWSELTYDGYRLDGTVAKVQSEKAQTIGADLFEIDLSLSWKRGMKSRSITLKTLKLLRPTGQVQPVPS